MMSRSPLRIVLEMTVSLTIVALVVRGFVVMGLVVPVTVAGSSMSPTLLGSHYLFRCGECGREFPVGVDEVSAAARIACESCGRQAATAESEEPTGGDRLLIDRTAYLWREPRRWEVIVFRCPEEADRLCVKRVVGLPGETISFAGGELVVDGRPIRRPYTPSRSRLEIRSHDRPERLEPTGDPPVEQWGWRLRRGEFFVVGDNAALSDDSRNWFAGPGLDAKLLIGKPLGVR